MLVLAGMVCQIWHLKVFPLLNSDILKFIIPNMEVHDNIATP